MDTLSHGLWGIVLTKILNSNKLLLAFLAGILPDIIPFGLIFTQLIFSETRIISTSANVPSYVPFLYNFTHSLIIVALVFLIIYFFKKKVYIWLLAWPLHIIYDIFTHSKEFFPTLFLYPLSDYIFNGISWATPWVFFTNWILLITTLIYIFRKNIKNKFSKGKN